MKFMESFPNSSLIDFFLALTKYRTVNSCYPRSFHSKHYQSIYSFNSIFAGLIIYALYRHAKGNPGYTLLKCL